MHDDDDGNMWGNVRIKFGGKMFLLLQTEKGHMIRKKIYAVISYFFFVLRK